MEENHEFSEIDERLPQRLFATNRYPSNRLNVYSSPEILSFLSYTLKGTLVLEALKKSVFGKLFDLPLYQCSISGKLVHGLLSRQLVSKKVYELWTTFGGHPLRFSLLEFGNITGLPCHEYPEDYDPKDVVPTSTATDPFWIQLIGPDPKTTLADIAALIEANPTMHAWRLIRLAFLLIVDGVLIATHQTHRPTLKYVLMLKDLRTFNEFPWGRESFFYTIQTMKPGIKIAGKCEDPVGIFRQQLQQQTLRLQGFPLALQFLAFKAIPDLDAKLHHANKEQKICDLITKHIPKQVVLTLADILEVESSQELFVKPVMESEEPEIEGWGEWYNEVKDRRISHLEELINNNHCFKPSHFPGGDTSLPIKVHEPKLPQGIHRVHIIHQEKGASSKTLSVRKKANKSRKNAPARKQTELPQSLHEPSNAELLEQIQHLAGEVEDLKKLTTRLQKKLKRKKRRRFGKLSSKQRGLNPKPQPLRSSSTQSQDINEASPSNRGEHCLEDSFIVVQNSVDASVETPLSPLAVAALYQNQYGTPPKQKDVSTVRESQTSKNLKVHVDNVPVTSTCVHAEQEKLEVSTSLLENSVQNTEKVHVDDLQKLSGCTQTTLEYSEPAPTLLTPKNTNSCSKITSEAQQDNEAPLKHIVPYKRKRSTRNNKNVEEISDAAEEKHCPSPMEINLARMLQSKTITETTELLPNVDEKEFKVFEETLTACQNVRHHIPNHFSFDNKFLLELTRKTKWVSELHMEVLMSYLNRRHASLLSIERACFVSPWTIMHFQSKYRSGKKIKDFWDERLAPIVKKPGETWIKDIDTLYAPMLWNEKHWVGLAIHLKLWYIEVLDPFTSLYKQENIANLLAPVVEILPHIIAHLCKPSVDESVECELSQQNGLKPFQWTRLEGVYDNKRGGDCGPVVAKFMELQLNDDPLPGMKGITNKMVDDFRKAYAMDLYKEFVMPLYTH